MVIGGYDKSIVDGEINWVDCDGSFHVQVPLDGIIVNGHTIKRVDNFPMQAIIDVCLLNSLADLVWHRRNNTWPFEYRSKCLQSVRRSTSRSTTRTVAIPMRLSTTDRVSTRGDKLLYGPSGLYNWRTRR